MKLKNKSLAAIIGITVSLGLIVVPIVATTSIISKKNNTTQNPEMGMDNMNGMYNFAKKTLSYVKTRFAANINKDWNSLTKLNDEAKQAQLTQKVQQFSQSILDRLNSKITDIENVLDSVTGNDELIQMVQFYADGSEVLNKVLKNILDTLIKKVNDGTQISDPLTFVKEELNKKTLEDLRYGLLTILDGNAKNLVAVANQSFKSLRDNDETKNIPVVDSLITDMTTFYENEIKTLANQVKEISFDNLESEGIEAQLVKFKDVLKTFREDSRVEAHKLITNEQDYETIKKVLYPKFEILFNIALESETILKEKVKDLIAIINVIIK
ncbi:hypothetical protein [Mycoplasma miroungirhinis]|uniref:Uncharacterized protein n=1 Tax=Mycoplasma miroungirhinis TaxID=754516 RepID=A0A6M4JDG7_9MOLU|nr:hypothetical protein [Mycoplasma miroungirhinis]QJR44106.1 hypothetical protein HLA92_01500 [Mycoplasma miroungirhinis]